MASAQIVAAASPLRPLLTPAPRVPNALIAVGAVLAAAAMFFGGLVSAYVVARATSAEWLPETQTLTLTRWRVAANSLCLVISAFTLAKGVLPRILPIEQRRHWLGTTIGLGAAFVVLQGAEWERLIRQGFVVAGDQYAAFFYLLLGAHAVHVLGGVGWLAVLRAKVRDSKRSGAQVAAAAYWAFVVGLWPVLYGLVFFT